MQVVRTFGHLFGGTLLVAGTSIGVGMLALPVATAEGGFLPSLAIYILCWLFMLCTGLLVLEACIWMPNDSNLITMATRLLGKGGKFFCWCVYLFLFSSLMVAHVAGGGGVIAEMTQNVLPNWLSVILYVLAFAPAVYLGTRWVDRLNIALMVGVVISYLLFIFSSFSYVKLEHLSHAHWTKALGALPVVFTAFGYQSLIPTLATYMNRDIKKLRIAIVLGTSLPLLIYVVWEYLIMGIVPAEGPGGLIEAMKEGKNAVSPLGEYLKNPTLFTIGHAFAFFAMTTSFVGISIAFVDFLADGLKVKKKGIKKVGLCALVFITPIIITLIYPNIFIAALSYAGGIGVALLLGIMPILMVWSGRYYHGHSLLHQQLPGGKIFLSVLLAFVLFELFIQLG